MDKDKRRERDRIYKRRRYKKYKIVVDKYNQKYISDNPEKRLFWGIKNSAKGRNTEFSITIEDIIIPKSCPLLGIELTNILGRGGVIDSNPSVDRIDNSKGYIKGNVWVISKLANRMKSSATKEQLLMFAKNVNKIYG